jgi:hypothetical protein
MHTIQKQTRKGWSMQFGTGTAARLARTAASVMLPLSLGACLAASHGVASARGAAQQQEFVVELPAVDLPIPADHADHHGGPQPEPYWTVSPASGWVHGFTVEVVNSRGDTVPRSVMHHVKLMRPDIRELFMPIMLRLVGAGSETREARMPHSIGFPIQAGDSLLATAMLHNPTGREHEGVRIRLRIHYTPSDERAPPVMAYPFFLHVTPPDQHSGYDLPPGRSEKSWEASPAVAGRLLGLGGHIHRYGTELRLEEVGSGRVLWRARPRLDAEGHVVEVPRKVFVWSRGIRVHPDRLYRVTAVYDNPTGHTLVDAGMATIGGIVAPQQPWPRVDRAHPVYALDRARELVSRDDHHTHQHQHHGQHR